MCVGCNFFGEKEDGKLGCIAATEQEREVGCEEMAKKKAGGCGCSSKNNSCSE
jgi:hypothetical protein